MPSERPNRLHFGWQVLIGALAWLALISFLHYQMNFAHYARRVLRLGYMPVITNLAAPLVDQASKEGEKGARSRYRFVAMKYASFAEMAESLREGHIDGAFMISPLSIVLRQQGADVNVVYIGNRHESTLVARKNLHAKTLSDLAGKTIAVPMRYSPHNVALRRLLAAQPSALEINIVEMNPPDMAAGLAAGSLDAYFVGEPFAAKSIFSGKADRILNVEDVWKGFICNLLVVRQDLIKNEPDAVQALVTGAARSGLWARDHMEAAADIAAKYWGQSPDLVKYAMGTPPGRIVYDRFIPVTAEMQEIADFMVKFGLAKSADIKGLVDDHFAKAADLDGIRDFDTILPR